MIDWGARIEDLMHVLGRHHNVSDRLAVEVMLGALVNCPRTPATWLILETNWHDPDCLDAWFSLGETWVPHALTRLRGRHSYRMIEEEMKGWIDCPSEERLFIEPNYDQYPKWAHITQSQYLCQRSLRLRLRTLRSADPLRSLDRQLEERISDEVAAATRHVLDDHAGARPPDPPKFAQPSADFLYYVELVQRLAPWYNDWHILVRCFAAIAVRRAFLYGRTETNAEDNAAIARVAADSVPLWIAKALSLMFGGPAKPMAIEKAMCLEENRRRTGHGSHRELLRLRRNGIIQFNRPNLTWSLEQQHDYGVRTLLQGKAFGLLASVA